MDLYPTKAARIDYPEMDARRAYYISPVTQAGGGYACSPPFYLFPPNVVGPRIFQIFWKATYIIHGLVFGGLQEDSPPFPPLVSCPFWVPMPQEGCHLFAEETTTFDVIVTLPPLNAVWGYHSPGGVGVTWRTDGNIYWGIDLYSYSRIGNIPPIYGDPIESPFGGYYTLGVDDRYIGCAKPDSGMYILTINKMIVELWEYIGPKRESKPISPLPVIAASLALFANAAISGATPFARKK